MQLPGAPRRPDLSRALAQYRRRANTYDRELAIFEPLRVEAIRRLALHPGQTVLDIGCGTGLSFEGLHRGVGSHGRIVGVDPSAEMMARARERVAEHRWKNVDLQVAAAADAKLQGRADAALFHFTHDVLRDRDSVDHVLAHLKRGAHLVATGLQWAPLWAWPANGFVLMAALYSVSSLDGLGKPWDRLADRLYDVKLDRYALGAVYMLSGRLAARTAARHAR